MWQKFLSVPQLFVVISYSKEFITVFSSFLWILKNESIPGHNCQLSSKLGVLEVVMDIPCREFSLLLHSHKGSCINQLDAFLLLRKQSSVPCRVHLDMELTCRLVISINSSWQGQSTPVMLKENEQSLSFHLTNASRFCQNY